MSPMDSGEGGEQNGVGFMEITKKCDEGFSFLGNRPI